MATDKETNARLLRTYGITLEEYNEMLVKQGGVCAICESPPKSRRLHTDHDHKWKYAQKDVYRDANGDGWVAETNYGGFFSCWAEKRSEVLRTIRKYMQKASVRGLLCPHCNRGLRVFRDNPQFLANAAKYLERFNNGMA